MISTKVTLTKVTMTLMKVTMTLTKVTMSLTKVMMVTMPLTKVTMTMTNVTTIMKIRITLLCCYWCWYWGCHRCHWFQCTCVTMLFDQFYKRNKDVQTLIVNNVFTNNLSSVCAYVQVLLNHYHRLGISGSPISQVAKPAFHINAGLISNI